MELLQGLFFTLLFMKSTCFFLFLLILSSGAAQNEGGSLRHYQRSCTDCIQLPGNPFEKDKFQIMIGPEAYSGGIVSIKKMKEEFFQLKKVVIQFDEKNVTEVKFKVKGKKNRKALDVYLLSNFELYDSNASSGKFLCTGKRYVQYTKFKSLSGTNYHLKVIPNSFKEDDPIE